MPTDITKIPIQELKNDRAESLADIKVCELALLHDVGEYSGGKSVQERLEVNQRIVNRIDTELARRLGDSKMTCEKCWTDAYLKAQVSGESQYAEYKQLLAKRQDDPCTPKQQAGQYWNEKNQCDSRKSGKEVVR